MMPLSSDDKTLARYLSDQWRLVSSNQVIGNTGTQSRTSHVDKAEVGIALRRSAPRRPKPWWH